MTFTLDNIFTVRRETVVADPAPEGQKPASATLTPSYFDVARLRLGTGYDLGEAGRKRHLELYSRRPMLDLMADMSVTPAPWIGFSGKVYISPYTGDVTRSDQTVTLSNARWGSWSVGHSSRNWQYDYARKVQRDSLWDIQFENSLSLLTNTVNLHLFPRWNVGYYSSTNLRDGETYERRVSLMYSHQCFNLVGQYVDKGRERSYRFSIELLGIND